MRKLTVFILAAALLFTSCTTQGPITEAIETGQLSELQSLDQLATDFNDDDGSPRLILLLSPT